MRKGPGSPGLTWTSLGFAESKDVLAHVAPTCSSRKTDLGRNGGEGGVWDEVKAGWLWSELCVCISLLPYKMGNWLASGFVRKKKWIYVCERTLCTGRSFQHITDDRRASLNLGPTKEWEPEGAARSCPQSWDCLPSSPGARWNHAACQSWVYTLSSRLVQPAREQMGLPWSHPTPFPLPILILSLKQG